MPQSWIQPNQNSLMDTFAQAEKLKAYRGQNALAEAKIAELPYAREREEALNAANIGKANAQAGSAKSAMKKTDAEIAMDTAEFVGRDPTNRPAVIGAMRLAAQTLPAITPIIEKLEATQDPAEFASLTSKFSMTTKEAVDQKLNEQKFVETQKQSGIDNAFQQGQLNVSQGHLDVSRGNAAETARHHGVMENRPQAGFSMSYDAEGRPVMSYGTGKALTEGQAKSTTNVTAANVANTELSNLKEGGFDPASASGGINTWMAETPGLNWAASEEGQRQHAANTGFAQAVNYQRSGAATPELEYGRAVDSMMDRYGDKPAAKEYKTRMRDALVQAIAAGGGPQVDQIVQQIMANNKATGGGPGRAALPPSPNLPPTAALPQKEFDAMPMPGEYAGKRIKTPDGVTYRSNGSQWMRE